MNYPEYRSAQRDAMREYHNALEQARETLEGALQKADALFFEEPDERERAVTAEKRPGPPPWAAEKR
jgi:hypothetical protein